MSEQNRAKCTGRFTPNVQVKSRQTYRFSEGVFFQSVGLLCFFRKGSKLELSRKNTAKMKKQRPRIADGLLRVRPERKGAVLVEGPEWVILPTGAKTACRSSPSGACVTDIDGSTSCRKLLKKPGLPCRNLGFLFHFSEYLGFLRRNNRPTRGADKRSFVILRCKGTIRSRRAHRVVRQSEQPIKNK